MALTVLKQKPLFAEKTPSIDAVILVRDYVKDKLTSAVGTEVTLTARKVTRYHGLIDDESAATRVGLALRYLAQLGYLKCIRTRKPHAYLVTQLGRLWALICRWPQCSNDSSICGLHGCCPIHKLEVRKQ
ncbi:MAG: hypothetical protein J7L51_02330 [Desulfurococcales archaeon]|nr:hypothetical protein [Desulfurococcales archaeon]